MASLWEKIAKDLQEGVLTVSEKASEWLKSGAEALRGGMEVASAKAAYASKLAKLKWEQNALQRDIEKIFTALGGQAYELHVAGKLAELGAAAQDKFEQLRKLEADLDAKEKEIEDLPKSFSPAQAQQAGVSELRKDMESGGGTVMQITIPEQSSLAGKKLKEVALPADVMVGMVVRGEEVIVANAETTLSPGDQVTLLGKKTPVQQAVEMLGGTIVESAPSS